MDEEGETAEGGSHQRAMRKRSLFPHYLCYAIRELMCSCFVVSQWHARRRREASPWMTCCPLGPDDGTRMGNDREWAGQGSKATWKHDQKRRWLLARTGIDIFFLFLLFSIVLELYNDITLNLHPFPVVITASCTLFWYRGRRREWDLLLLAAVSWSKVSERIREILERCALLTLCHRLLVNKSIWRWGYAFLSICRTTPVRLSTIRALKQVLREHALAGWRQLRGTAKTHGSKHLLDAFESTFGGTLGRLLTMRCTKRETKLVCLTQA